MIAWGSQGRIGRVNVARQPCDPIKGVGQVALIVLLRGVNVGGHRTFRPSRLAAELAHLDAVNIGAAGTFVIRRPVGRAALRAEFARRLPFVTEVTICEGRDWSALIARHASPGPSAAPGMVRFVSVLARAVDLTGRLPMQFPADGEWLVQLSGQDGRFLLGRYRRHVKTIGQLGAMDRAFGASITTRNWNTVMAVGRVLDAKA